MTSQIMADVSEISSNWLHAAESFLTSRQSLRYSNISPTFYTTQRFIAVFTSYLYRSLSSDRWIQSIPRHPLSLKSILILPSNLHLCLGFSNGLYFYDVSTWTLHAFLLPPLRATCLANLIILELSFWFYLAKSINHEAPHYVTSSSLLLFH
jgi:hypothetical protein